MYTAGRASGDIGIDIFATSVGHSWPDHLHIFCQIKTCHRGLRESTFILTSDLGYLE